MPSFAASPFTVNDRTYRPPARPVVVVCIDGGADEYLDAALARGRMPHLQAMTVRGYRGLARSALPSFTNPNNVSLVTGVPPSIHGISGNFFLDIATGAEVMMNAPDFLRAPTILAAAARAGRKVAMVTAKEKLRALLSHDLVGISVSAEKAGEARRPSHGVEDVEALAGQETPTIYSAEASLFVLRTGVAVLERGLADLLYLSLTDYVQHLYAPEDPEALAFYARIDTELGRIEACGALLGITADHGMNAKQTPTGAPNVIYLENELARALDQPVRVICPITDPYVVHHGALGSFVSVHLADAAQTGRVRDMILAIDGVTEVHDRESAARKLELPGDRIGDLVALSGRDVVIGRRPEDHDLRVLRRGLRSHGGRYEEMVPMIVSRPLTPDYARRAAGDLRNFDVFDLTLNGCTT